MNLFNFLFKQYVEDQESLNVWLILSRFVTGLILLLGLSIFWGAEIFDFDMSPIIWGWMPLYFGSNIAWFLVIKRSSHQRFILNAQIFTDILFMTCLVYLSGGIHSELAFIYIIPLISAVLISPIATVSFGLLTVVFYGLLIYMEHMGFISPVLEQHFGFHNDEKIRIGIWGILTAMLVFQGSYFMMLMKKKNSEIMKMKDDFLFKTAHDLQNPLKTISWIVEEISSSDNIDDPKIKERIREIKNLGKRDMDMIHDLLEIGKGRKEEEIIKLEKVNARAIMSEAVSGLEGQIKKMNIMVDMSGEVSGDVWVYADAAKLREIFSNILDNAIKYNSNNGTVRISYSKDGRIIRISIWNNGREIPKSDLLKLFTPYFRGSMEGKVSGTGLGLYIVKKFIERMKGDIEIKSGNGEGTEVIIRLPEA